VEAVFCGARRDLGTASKDVYIGDSMALNTAAILAVVEISRPEYSSATARERAVRAASIMSRAYTALRDRLSCAR
jgi:hypothetical protein